MNVTITLTHEEEIRLKAEAASRGTNIEDLAHRLVSAQLPPLTAQKGPTLALLEEWDREDATDDPQELAMRQRDWKDVREGLAASPVSLRLPKA